MATSKLSVIYSEKYLDHITGDHVDNPKRAAAIIDALQSASWARRLSWVSPKPASAGEIELIHSREHINFVRKACDQASGSSYLDVDTPVSRDSYEVALLAAGGVMAGVELVLSGASENFFAVVRPPGHHAEFDEAHGFCIFNNVAIGAMYAVEKLGIERVFILDWDVHHGNGTQHSFENDPRVFFCSFHQYPHYPGTGSMNEFGRGDGLGYTLNLPMRAGSTNDDYVYLLEEVAGRAMAYFRPQLLLVSAGFDAHIDDPLSSTAMTEEGFSAMMEITQSIVGNDCPIGMVFEGGYNVETTASSAAASAGILVGEATTYVSLSKSPSRIAYNLGQQLLSDHPFLQNRPDYKIFPMPEHGEEIRKHVESFGDCLKCE